MAAEFPGFARLTTLASLLVKTASAHGVILNGAWDGILKANYGHKELLRDTAKFYQSHFDLLNSLMPNAHASLPNIPSWLTLDATKHPTKQALSGTVEVREFDATNGKPTPTPLAALSNLNVYFNFSVTPQDPTHLGVQITSVVSNGGVPVDLREDDDAIATAAKNYSGTYLGLIRDQRAGTNAPLAVVIFLI